MKKRKRELTQFQLDRRVYNAFADQAYMREWKRKNGVDMPWEDPTRAVEVDDE